MESNSFTIERLSNGNLTREQWKFEVIGNKIVLVAYFKFTKEEAPKAKFSRKSSYDVYNQSTNTLAPAQVPEPDDVLVEALQQVVKPFTVMNWTQYRMTL